MVSESVVKWIALAAFAAGSIAGYVSGALPPLSRYAPVQSRETIVKKNDLGREFWHKSQERWT